MSCAALSKHADNDVDTQNWEMHQHVFQMPWHSKTWFSTQLITGRVFESLYNVFLWIVLKQKTSFYSPYSFHSIPGQICSRLWAWDSRFLSLSILSSDLYISLYMINGNKLLALYWTRDACHWTESISEHQSQFWSCSQRILLENESLDSNSQHFVRIEKSLLPASALEMVATNVMNLTGKGSWCLCWCGYNPLSCDWLGSPAMKWIKKSGSQNYKRSSTRLTCTRTWAQDNWSTVIFFGELEVIWCYATS